MSGSLCTLALRSGTGDVDSAVEVLLQRVADGVLAEDRREALADLRDLLSNNAQVRACGCISECVCHACLG